MKAIEQYFLVILFITVLTFESTDGGLLILLYKVVENY